MTQNHFNFSVGNVNYVNRFILLLSSYLDCKSRDEAKVINMKGQVGVRWELYCSLGNRQISTFRKLIKIFEIKLYQLKS